MSSCLKGNIKLIHIISICFYQQLCLRVSVHQSLANCAAPMLAGHCNAGTYPNMSSSWPRGQCSCLAHNSDWLEYQWRELNPSSCWQGILGKVGSPAAGIWWYHRGNMCWPTVVVLFNTVASKQLITLSKRLEEGYTLQPWRANWEPND